MIAVVITAIVLVIYLPVLRWLANSWLSSDYLSHGFEVPLVSAFIIWLKRDSLREPKFSVSGIGLLVLGVLLYTLGFVNGIKFLGALSLISVITGLVWLFFGLRAVRALLFPLVFLLFVVPWPFLQDLMFRLQEISVYFSSWILEHIGLPISTSGAEIHLGDTTFTVGLVCSGINTLLSLLALAALYIYFLKGRFSGRLGLFLLAIPLAILANILRIASIIIVAYFVNIPTATGWYHTLSSPLFFILAFLALIGIGRAFKFRLNYDLLRGR